MSPSCLSKVHFQFLDELNEVKANEKAFGLDKNDVDDLDMTSFSYKL